MRLYYKAVEIHVKSLLRQRGNQLTAASDMTRVAYERQTGYATFQLNRYAPFRNIPVEVVSIRTESTVNGTETAYAGGVNALQRTNPKLKVGIDRILDQNSDGFTTCCGKLSEHIGNLLHGKRIGRSPGADPERFDTGTQCGAEMCCGGDLCHRNHARLLTHISEPWQSTCTHTLERTGACPWFPDTGAETAYSGRSESTGGGKHLLARLRAARSCNYQRL